MDPVSIGSLLVGIIATIFTVRSFYRSTKEEQAQDDLSKEEGVLDEIMREKKLIIGAVNFPPFSRFNRLDDHTEYSELYVDLLREVGNIYSIDIEFRAVRASQILPSLEARKVHAIACLMQTSPRAKFGDVVDAKVGVPVIGVVRGDCDSSWDTDRLRDPNTKIAAVAGEIGEELASTRYGATPENGRLETIDTDDVPRIYSYVSEGHADIALTSGTRWLQFQRRENAKSDELRSVFVDPPLLLVPCGIFVRDNDEQLRHWLEEAFAKAWEKPHLKAGFEEMLNDYSPYVVRI